MTQPAIPSKNRFSALRDEENPEDDYRAPMNRIIPTQTSNSLRSTNIVNRSRAELPLREIPEALHGSSRRITKEAQHTLRGPKQSKLCSACASIFNQERSEEWFGKWHEHHQSRTILDRAVNAGCAICIVIQEAVEKDDQGFGANRTLQYMIELSENLEFTLQVSFMTDHGSPYDEPDFPYLYEMVMVRSKGKLHGSESAATTEAHNGSDMEPNLSKHELGLSTASQEVLDQCRTWLRACRTQHGQCGHLRTDSHFRPSRLIYVSKDDTGSIRARLDCADANDKSPAYLTLSHCWGLRKFFTLNTSNLRQLQEDLELSVLPRAFQDALFLTLEFGFSYIWIDSLCIVQDSKEDWLAESVQMGNVYKNSSCNIAATGFSDGSRGFFAERDTNRLVCPSIYAEWAGEWGHKKGPRRGHYHIVNPHLWEHEVGKAPLNRRGWVLQERLLSPCILHFGTRQVFWECFESYSCEIFPHGFPFDVFRPYSFKSLKFYDTAIKEVDRDTMSVDEEAGWQKARPKHKVRNAQRPKSAKDSQELYKAWHAIVEAYSICDLTKPEDKFLAISGAAKNVQQISRDNYLAGLWERSVVRDLLWHAHSERQVKVLPLNYRAPTWSWASLNAPVRYTWSSKSYDDERDTLHAQFISARLSHQTEDKTGLMSGGNLRISGRLAEVKCISRHSWSIDGLDLNMTVHLDLQTDSKWSAGATLTRQDDSAVGFSMGSGFQYTYFRKDPVYLFPVRTGDEPGSDWEVLVGLILTPTGRGRAEYMRHGLFVTEDPEACQLILKGASRLNRNIWGQQKDGQCTIVLV